MILITRLFPVWVLLFSAISLFFPATFSWFNGAAITISLGIIMLGMGITLTIGDFERIFRFPKFVLIGVLLQYTVMPASGWVISYMMNLPAPLALGLILVSACPGGTASNVITYLAKGDVALSVTMTSVSTILSVILTPFLTFLLAGNKIEVNPYSLMLSTFEVVILPVAVGVVMNRYLKNFTAKIIPASPLVAVILITLIVSSVIGSSKNEILESGVNLLISVFLLHSSGFFFGYIISRILSKDIIIARTVSIEVGMQNSGLGVVLARDNFSNPAIAVPSAISSLFHSLISSVLAGIWARNPKPENPR